MNELMDPATRETVVRAHTAPEWLRRDDDGEGDGNSKGDSLAARSNRPVDSASGDTGTQSAAGAGFA